MSDPARLGTEGDDAAADAPRPSRPLWLLVIGALLGMALAARGLVVEAEARRAALGDEIVAVVNGSTITLEQYERAVSALATDKRNPLTDQDRKHVLDRMIEEELLIQRGVEVGLVDSDSAVRKSIASAMIQAVVADAESEEPTTRELERFFDENRGYFTSPGRLRVRRMLFRAGEGDLAAARGRAEQAAAALAADEDWDAVAERLADRSVLEVPDTLLPPHKLREYLGPTLVRAAAALDTGAISGPVESASSVHVLWLVDRTDPPPPAYPDVAPQVAAEVRRRRGDTALREYLEFLREEAEIEWGTASRR